MSRLFVEAESFKNLGGWVVDQQSVNIMGSSYLMAHGMGVSVADATTDITIPESNIWHAWVRTRDWTAVWERGSAAGIFKLKANGTCFENILGNNGKDWDWQYAGSLELKKGDNTLSLCDLTGFNGRCDAIYLSTDKSDAPENTEEFRKKASGIKVCDDERFYDLVVCGGGFGGTCMALAAMREGLSVAIIQDRPVLGGCNSSEIKVGLGGWAHGGPYPNLGNTVDQISPVFNSPGSFDNMFYEDDRKLLAFKTIPLSIRKNCSQNLCEHLVGTEMDGDKITAVISQNIYTGQQKRYCGRLFADCTGDAVLARFAGAEVMYGREAKNEYNERFAPEVADNMVMGMTIPWHSEEKPCENTFPDIDWGIEFDEERCYPVFDGDWEWEVGQFRDMVNDIEYIRDYSLMTIFGNWSFLKNRYSGKERFKNRSLKWISPLGGKRESYRVKGDVILTENDIENHTFYEDGSAALTWDIDIHYPEPENLKLFPEPFRSCAVHRGIKKHYPVPYRCLYSKDISNLFLGGRNLSTTHVAFACVRVMRTLGTLGEVCGLAAGVCVRENCLPREVYEKHLDKLKVLMERGVVINPMHAYPPNDDESLAFKECNTFMTYPVPSLPLDDKEWMWKINHTGIPFIGNERYKGIEEREELTPEEKEIAQRFHNDVLIK